MNKQIKKVGYQQDNPIQEMNIKSKDNLMEVLETIDKKSIKIEKIEADVDLEKKSFKKKFPYFFTGTELIGMKLNHIPFLWEPYIKFVFAL